MNFSKLSALVSGGAGVRSAIRLLRAMCATLSLLLMVAATGTAAKGVTPKNITPTKLQIAQTQQLMRELDAKIRSAFKGDEKLADAMQTDLKGIASNKSAATKRAAVTQYQTKYAKDYGEILKKAGVDLVLVANKMNAIYPMLHFQAKPNYTILATLLETAALVGNPLSGSGVTTSSLQRALTFADTKSLSCSALGGGNVDFSSTSVTNSVSAAEVGGCYNYGDKTATIAFPAGAISAHLDVTSKLEIDSFAIGIGGGAMSNGGACATWFAHTLSGDLDSDCVSVSALAPMSWAASAEAPLNPLQLGQDLQPDTHYDLQFITSTSAVAAGVVAETNTTAAVSKIDGALTVQR